MRWSQLNISDFIKGKFAQLESLGHTNYINYTYNNTRENKLKIRWS